MGNSSSNYVDFSSNKTPIGTSGGTLDEIFKTSDDASAVLTDNIDTDPSTLFVLITLQKAIIYGNVDDIKVKINKIPKEFYTDLMYNYLNNMNLYSQDLGAYNQIIHWLISEKQISINDLVDNDNHTFADILHETDFEKSKYIEKEFGAKLGEHPTFITPYPSPYSSSFPEPHSLLPGSSGKNSTSVNSNTPKQSLSPSTVAKNLFKNFGKRRSNKKHKRRSNKRRSNKRRSNKRRSNKRRSNKIKF